MRVIRMGTAPQYYDRLIGTEAEIRAYTPTTEFAEGRATDTRTTWFWDGEWNIASGDFDKVNGTIAMSGPLRVEPSASFSSLPAGTDAGAVATFESGGQVWGARKYADRWIPDWSTRDCINCLVFGADPTNTTDSTEAINNAIAFACSLGVLAYLPPGDYTTSSPILIGAPGGLVGGATNYGNLKTRIYTTHLDSPALWIKSGRVLISGLTIVDAEFLDEITPKNTFHSGIEICEGLRGGVGVAAQNCMNVNINNVQIQGFYDSIHVAIEADLLQISDVALNRYENAGISFLDDRGYDAWPAVAPTSGARIERVFTHHWDIIRKCYADGKVARGRYGIELKAVSESSFRELIMNSALCGVYCHYSVCNGLTFDTLLMEHEAEIVDYVYDKSSSLAVVTGSTLRVLSTNITYANGWIYYVVAGGTIPSGQSLNIESLGGEITVGGAVLRAAHPYAGFYNNNSLAQMQIQNTRIGRPIWARTHGNTDASNAPVFSFKRITTRNYNSQLITGRNAAISIEDSSVPSLSVYNPEPGNLRMSLSNTAIANHPRSTWARNSPDSAYQEIAAASTSIQASTSAAEVYAFTGATAQEVTLVADGQYTRSDTMCRGLEVVITSKNPTTVTIKIGATTAATLSNGQFARYKFVSYAAGWVRVG